MKDFWLALTAGAGSVIVATAVIWLASRLWKWAGARFGTDFVIQWHSPGAWKITRVRRSTAYYLSVVAAASGPNYGFMRQYVRLTSDEDMPRGDWTLINVEDPGPWAFMWVSRDRRISQPVHLVEGSTDRIKLRGRAVTTKDEPWPAI